MIVNLKHNKIIADTITHGFEESVNENLIPMLRGLYGDALEGICMYEDYIADKLEKNGQWYYPLTVYISSAPTTVWVKWSFSDKSRFEFGVPYAYVGDAPLEFTFADAVPEEFIKAIAGRRISPIDNTMHMDVFMANGSITLLSGKYSQSFIDEMAYQLCAAISRGVGVSGLESSDIELHLVFAPGTYMEHTSDNVTYRRLLISDKASRPRDFWVKWTRLDGIQSYSVSDSVSTSDIKFELGEDVPQKIREKEFRFLCRTHPDRYQSAMGKKTVTEWRDITKRAIKRGELLKVATESDIADHATEVSDKLNEIMNAYSISIPQNNEPVAAPVEDDLAMMARAALGFDKESQPKAEQTTKQVFDIFDEDVETSDEPTVEMDEVAEQTDDTVFDSEFILEDESDEEIALFDEIEAENIEISEAMDEPEQEYAEDGEYSEEEYSEEENVEAEDEIVLEETTEENDEQVAELLALDGAEEEIPSEQEEVKEEIIEQMDAMRLESVRAELEAKLRLEYEQKAREKAEAEVEKLRTEISELRRENDRLVALAEENDRLAKLVEENRAREAEGERLLESRTQIAEDEVLKLKTANEELVRENERLTKLVNIAEQNRIREAQERALDRERSKAEVARRLEEEMKLREKLEIQMRQEQREKERLAEAARLALEEQKRLESAQPEPKIPISEKDVVEKAASSQEFPIVSKVAKFMFNKPTDTTTIKAIKGIVEQTLLTNKKETVKIYMKAYAVDETTINLNISFPENETKLVVDIIQAIGKGGLGVIKVVLE